MAGSVGAGLAAGLLTGGAEQFIDIGDKALQERAQMRRDQAKALRDAKAAKAKSGKDKKAPKTLKNKKTDEYGNPIDENLEWNEDTGRYSKVVTDEQYGKYQRVLLPMFGKGMKPKEAAQEFYNKTGQRVPPKVMKMAVDEYGNR